MTKTEFLGRLQNALASELSESQIREHVNYYSQYIDGELVKGRSEANIMDELGDPWVIARTILDSAENQKTAAEHSESKQRTYQQRTSSSQSTRVYAMDTWWKKLLLVLVLIAVVVIVVTVIGGIFSLLAPIIIPIVIVLIILRLLGNK